MLYEKFRQEVEEGIREAEAGLASFDSTNDSPGHGSVIERKYKMTDLIRKDMCVQFGAFITESSGHLSEYLPYYRKNKEGQKLLRRGYEGGSRFYATNWPTWRKNADEHRMKLVRGEASIELQRSWEYASWIIEAREKDSPVPHPRQRDQQCESPDSAAGEGGKLITNLPGDGAVEVACMIDRNGINPTRYGALPRADGPHLPQPDGLLRSGGEGVHRKVEGSGRARPAARPADVRDAEPARDPEDDAGDVRRRARVPAGVSLMKTQRIGKTDLVSTRLSYGCMRIAGTWDPKEVTPERPGRRAAVRDRRVRSGVHALRSCRHLLPRHVRDHLRAGAAGGRRACASAIADRHQVRHPLCRGTPTPTRPTATISRPSTSSGRASNR